MSADQHPQQQDPFQHPTDPGPTRTPGRFDVVALVAGLVFVLYSIFSLTVGVLDLPRLGSAPLWVILIGAGALLLLSEFRGRASKRSETTPSAVPAEQAAWEPDRYR